MVFHPGHDELHGFTVVLHTNGPMTYVGRWDAIVGGRIVLNDAATHRDGDEGLSKRQYLERLARTGPLPTRQRLAVPESEVASAQKLGDLARELES